MYGGINELMVEEVADDLHEEGGGRDGGEGQDGGPLKARCWPPAQSQSNSPALQKKGSKVSTKATTTPNATTTNHPHRGTSKATKGTKHAARGPSGTDRGSVNLVQNVKNLENQNWSPLFLCKIEF